jgi:hypothetical protein
MELLRAAAVVVAFIVIAWLYRSLPQNLGKLALRRARLSAGFRAAYRTRLEGELASYRAALAEPPTFHTQALHLQALLILSATMTLLAVLLFIASQLVQPRLTPDIAAFFPAVDALLALFFLFSIVGLRLAVFRSWMFLHKERNLRRLQGTIAALGGSKP